MGRIFRPKRKMPDGSTWVSPKWYCQYQDHRGRQVRMPASTNKKRAQDILVEMEERALRLKEGLQVQLPATEAPLVGNMVKDFLADMKHRVKPSTYQDYEHDLNELLIQDDAPIKAHTVADITVTKLRKYQRNASDTLSPRSVNKKVRVVKAMLQWAVSDGTLPQNPLAGLKLLPNRPKHYRALEEDEIAALLEASPPQIADVWRFFLDTGLRKSEAATLRVRDINFPAKLLTVRAERSKNKRPRDLPLTAQVIAILKRLTKGKQPGDLVFHAIGARKDFYHGLWPHFKRYCEKAGIDSKELNVHSLRRTFCTRLIAKGASPGAAQRLLGHSTANLTLEIYTRVRASDLQDAVALLE